ncbi:ARP2/3 complex subunit, putative [Candida dubliniensis CD36]|uniref:ARP2/3 complex subunit, putative n=1 Tax=Candida dubliniensis (strain CD36 / ATCC MYA-646 / CBS 7987 / NCPF 3949 / NRRL Y-17841) TaxID=573826 RepID=B9WEY6_CANDC|nr:ARP2/3 complex subunit, putative [Candida dubliniensis CD36]CAX43249.1 ARP2/3 complex subunit, putative [Candida dubliniensis CD36]
MMLTQALLQKCRLYIPNRSLSLKTLRHKSLFAHKSIGRIPTTLYNHLTRFNQKSITIQPRMEYLPICHKLAHQNASVNTEVKLKNSPEKLKLMLETVTFHLLSIVDGSTKSITFFENLQNHFNKEPANLETDVEYFCMSTGAVPNKIHVPLCCFLLLSSQMKSNYSAEHLVKWIKSISSKSVIESYSFLHNLEEVPAFVLFDLMLRNPQFKEEFLLQKDIWLHNLKPFALQRIGQTFILKSIIDNLVYYGIMFESDALAETLKTTLDFFKSSRTGVNVDLGDDFINELIWGTALYSFRYSDIKPVSIANVQELLVTYLSSVEKLSFKAYMGITLVVSKVSRERGEKLYQIAESKFLNKETTSKEMVAYYMTQLYLAKSPEDLVHTFNVAIKKYELSSKLWLVFIRKMSSFDLLDETRASRILKKMVSTNVNITSDIVTELSKSVVDLSVLEGMTQMVSTDKARFFLTRYIQLLNIYDGSLSQVELPWDKEFDKSSAYKGFSSIADYTRYLCTLLPTTSIHQISLLLESEAKRNPQNTFQVYKKELLDKALSPNKKCLGVLLEVAYDHGDFEAWDRYRGPQVAIREFQRHIKTTKTGIEPNEWLWGKYIKLLSKYDYISELSKIMKWWDDLKFEPSKGLLVLLLSSLPREFSERHIKHHEKLQSKRDWPWPSIEEFNAFTVNRDTMK